MVRKLYKSLPFTLREIVYKIKIMFEMKPAWYEYFMYFKIILLQSAMRLDNLFEL